MADQSLSSSNESDSHLSAFFGPGGSAQQAIAMADAISKQYPSYTHDASNHPSTRMEEEDDDEIDGVPGDFLGMDTDNEFEFGSNAHGSSPRATAPLIILDHPPLVQDTPTSPPKQRSALRSTSFAPVATNPVPTMSDAVDDDPNFFEGCSKDGKGPGPHFITMSFIKDKTKSRDQLLKALASTVSILSANIPGVMVHCIQKDAKLPPPSSSTAGNFPTSGMQARNYLFIQNAWSLQPGTRNKPKLPAPKIGTDSQQLYDENRGYDGPA